MKRRALFVALMLYVAAPLLAFALAAMLASGLAVPR